MRRNTVSSMLAAILLLQAGPEARARILPERAPQEQASAKSSLKQRVLEIPPMSVVQVRLNNKERLRGRLGQVTDEGFVVKVAQKDKIEDRMLAFTDVKSIQAKKTGSSAVKVAAYIGIGAVAGLVVFILALRYHLSHS
ncbi:MAG: hypothetical protein ACYDA9_01140 [Terriglobia bacterium]